MDVSLPFVQPIKRKNGTKRYFFRRKGYKRKRLPGEPGSKEFLAAYQEAMAQDRGCVPSKIAGEGTIGALCREYRNSAAFTNKLAKSTQREMGYVLNQLEAQQHDVMVADLIPADIERWQDDLKETPGAANKMLRTLRVVLSFGVRRNYRSDNPAKAVELLKGGEFRPWTVKELEAFERRWPLGSMERTGYALALYTGQRRADIAAIKFTSIAGGSFRLKQRKTGAELLIPIHPALKDALAAVHPRHEAGILTLPTGAKKSPVYKAMNPIYFGHMMAEAIEAAGLPDDCVLHGLRKSATVALIDAGCTSQQAAAITGHSTTRMIEHYSKKRDQEKLGKAAMLKWKRAKR